MRAINTRDIETPYIISNSYQIPYIIRENPGEGEILMHSRLNGVFAFLSTAYLQLYNTMQLESFDDSVPKIRAVSVVQDSNRFPFQWNWKGDSLQRPLLLRNRGVVDLKRRARCQTPLLPRKRQRLAQFTSRILRAPRLWQTSRGIVMGLEREKRVPKIGGD